MYCVFQVFAIEVMTSVVEKSERQCEFRGQSSPESLSHSLADLKSLQVLVKSYRPHRALLIGCEPLRRLYCDCDCVWRAENTSSAGHNDLERQCVYFNLGQLPFPDEAFDLVVSRYKLPSDESQLNALSEAARVLMAEGLLVIVGVVQGYRERHGQNSPERIIAEAKNHHFHLASFQWVDTEDIQQTLVWQSKLKHWFGMSARIYQLVLIKRVPGMLTDLTGYQV